MASEVKWIKIVIDIFNDEKMYAIESLPDGYKIELVWFKILCLAGKCNQSGLLTVNKKIPYTIEMLASIFRMDIGTVQRALEVFENLEMIEIIDNTYMVTNWSKYQSNDRLEEMRRKDRERKALKKAEMLAIKDNPDNSTENSTEFPRKIQGICSYSYSISFNNNKSNIENLIYILSESEYSNKDYINNNTELLNSIKEWFEYKDNKKPKSSNHYGTELGITKLLNKIVEADKKHGTAAVVNAIDNSIGNNYQGIVWDWLTKGVKSNGCTTGNAARPCREYTEDDIWK